MTNSSLKESNRYQKMLGNPKKRTTTNRSVYVIGAPLRDNRVTKEEGFVAGDTARPGCRRGSPSGVTVFANARINY